MKDAARSAPEPGPLIAQAALQIEVVRPGRIAEVAAWPGAEADIGAAIGHALGVAPPRRPGAVSAGGQALVMMLTRRRWMIEHQDDAMMPADLRRAIGREAGAVFDLSAARGVFAIDGACALALARKLVPVDFDDPRHGPGSVVVTGASHHLSFLLCREAEERFRLHVDRGYHSSMAAHLVTQSEEFLPG